MQEAFALFVWTCLWALGGVWLLRDAFNLRRDEQVLAGVGLGLVLENWLANLLGRFVSVPFAFWLAAGLVFLSGLATGLIARRDWRSFLEIPIRPLQVLALALLGYTLFAVGRGLAILDDYQNLPMTSILAAGDIPPHFALDPKLSFNYHYATLLFSAQVMRVGNVYVWTALDLVRGFGTALALILSGLFVRRFTRSSFLGFVAVMFGLFSGGLRWGMLLLPENLLEQLGRQITFIGSSAGLGPNFIDALLSPFPIESGATWNFPFAYMGGMDTAAVWTFQSGAGGLGGIITGLLLLSYHHWRGWLGGLVTVLLLSALALSNEVGFVGLCAGLVLVALAYLIRYRRMIPGSLRKWFVVVFFAGLVTLVQGGVISGVFLDAINNLFFPVATGQSYFSGSLHLRWPPALLSTHLGYLELTNPYHLLVLFFESNGLLLVGLPIAFVLAFKAFRSGHWYLVFGFAWSLAAILLAFAQYAGPAGPTALTRAQGSLTSLGALGFTYLPFVAARRKDWVKVVVACLILISMFGGIVLFGFELLSAPKPIYSTFIDVLDAQMMQRHWNSLETDALIFDPISYRAPTVFGRFTNSNITWYRSKPEWEKLTETPDPYAIRSAGFDYIYLDQKYWDQIGAKGRKLIEDSCVKVFDEVRAKRTDEFRRLLDIRNCQRE
ncbi:MAG: hypothetical protein WHV66_03255 [Anaerolineales bacterium]